MFQFQLIYLMSKMKLSVLIPSRSNEMQISFLTRCINSVRSQTIYELFDVRFIVGVDIGEKIQENLLVILGAQCVESESKSQAGALNACIREVTDGYVAFLEDDDEWMPFYLECAIQALNENGFVSSTQAEYNENDILVKINDFPTPSGWMMPYSTLSRVGLFNEQFRFHLDNEWLGRLSETKILRVHLMESTAPIEDFQFVRPLLLNLINEPSKCCQLVRHFSPYPLVKRLLHTKSGMYQIQTNAAFRDLSRHEKAVLKSRFGRVPW